jgi:hypothetical protein
MSRNLLLLLSAFFCVACSCEHLRVRSEYLNPGYLASTRVDTPDPAAICFYGQQLVIHYRMPAEEFCDASALLITLRYGNQTCETVRITLEKRRGYYTYRLINDDYWDRGGIFSYKVELSNGECVLSCKEHHLWVEIIDLPN